MTPPKLRVQDRAAETDMPATRTPRVQALPYGPTMTNFLKPLHRAFLIVNPLFAAALERGFGALISSPLTGHLIVLRTRGRRTGLIRAAPLGYVVLDGAIYCSAGFGETTAWYRNVLADPWVEVVLPGRTLRGRAAAVSEPDEWIRAYRALIASLGVTGRLTVGDVRGLDNAELLAAHGGIPLVRITPSAFVPGPLDPGGWFWLVPWAGSAVLAIVLATRRGHARGSPWLPGLSRKQEQAPWHL
jgi:deazaflavin-dependent oxidoreductase (nitroreductase family)